MTFTRHFHHIKGTTLEDEEGIRTPVKPIVCGGPGGCLDCTQDELNAFKHPPRFIGKNKSMFD